MNYIKHLNGFFERLSNDQRMTAYHISLYLILFQFWNLNRFQNPFPISRQELMALSRIGSVNTYARCVKELDSWGYISYFPSTNWHTGSKVSCIRFDTTTDTVTDTTSDTTMGIRSDTTTNTTSDTLFINRSNKNKQDKQHTPQIFKNGREKINGKSGFSVSNDKDYSEPL